MTPEPDQRGPDTSARVGAGARATSHLPEQRGFAYSLLTRDGAVVLELRGEFDFASAAAFEQAAGQALETGPEQLVVDLRELTFMDSSGLRAFLRLQARAPDSVRLEFIPGPHAVQRVFELAGLTAALPFRAVRQASE